MHLAYIDDSGNQPTSRVVLYGALVVRSNQFLYMEQIAGVAAEQLITPETIDQFTEFHTRDLFRGEKAFKDIDKDKRFTAINVLLNAFVTNQLHFIYSAIDRSVFATSAVRTGDPRDIAFRNCVLGVEAWAQTQHDSQPGTIRVDPNDLTLIAVDENRTDQELRETLKTTFRQLRARWLPTSALFQKNRLWHIHDAIYFGDSRDSVGLQIADMCAYFVALRLCGKLDDEGQLFYSRIEPHIMCAKPLPESKMLSMMLLDHKSI